MSGISGTYRVLVGNALVRLLWAPSRADSAVLLHFEVHWHFWRKVSARFFYAFHFFVMRSTFFVEHFTFFDMHFTFFVEHFTFFVEHLNYFLLK